MIENWLNQNIPGYEELSETERKALHHFSMLWSFFENYVLDCEGSASKILTTMESWQIQDRLKIEQFQTHLTYFQKRYVDEGDTNDKFEDLKFKSNDKKDLVKRVLLGSSVEIGKQVAAQLIITLRYRNNFFHGLKWQYGFKDQLANFNEANTLLTKIIKLQ